MDLHIKADGITPENVLRSISSSFAFYKLLSISTRKYQFFDQWKSIQTPRKTSLELNISKSFIWLLVISQLCSLKFSPRQTTENSELEMIFFSFYITNFFVIKPFSLYICYIHRRITLRHIRGTSFKAQIFQRKIIFQKLNRTSLIVLFLY